MSKLPKVLHWQGSRPRPSRRLLRTSSVLVIATAAFSTVAGLGGQPLLHAQGWDPFSQLETDDWQRRQPPPRRNAPQNGPRQTEREAGAYRPTAAQGIAPPSTIEMEPMAPLPGVDASGGAPAQPQYPSGNMPQGRPYAPDGRNEGNGPASAPYPAQNSADPNSAAPYGAQQDGRYAVRRYPDGSVDRGAPVPAEPSALSPPPSAPGAPFPPAAGGSRGEPLRHDLWQGLDVANLEKLMASLAIPPRSPALHDLWRRLLISTAPAPASGHSDEQFEALRLEALYRSGLLPDIREMLAQGSQHRGSSGGSGSPLIAMLQARSDIGLGDREAGCTAIKNQSNIRGDIPKSLRGEAILVSGYCAAATGNSAAAGLLAEIAREEGVTPSPGLAALDAVALGVATDVSLKEGQQLSLLDYRILALAEAAPPPDQLIKVAAPALLVALAADKTTATELRLEAAEAAVRLNAISTDDLAGIYREMASTSGAGGNAVESSAGGQETPLRRALLYSAADAEHTPFKKVRQIRAFLDSAHRAHLYLPALAIAGKLTADIGLAPEIGWFAETAIEASLAAGDYGRARMWTKFAATHDAGTGGNLDHWMALIDIADPSFPDARGASLAALESMALRGRFSSDALHRLATVLDALEYNVPIPLWEAASRTPQPSSGHLPETGILSELQDAAKKREFGRTVLLAMQALGPAGADGAHIISLGDSIRALKRAGQETDARRLGFEALLAGWPRMVVQ